MRKALGFIVTLLAFGLFGMAQAPKKTQGDRKAPVTLQQLNRI